MISSLSISSWNRRILARMLLAITAALSLGLSTGTSAHADSGGIVPGAAVADPSAPTGGLRFGANPVISTIECRTGCMARSTRNSHRISVREGARIVVRGRSLGSVQTVVFAGGSSSKDDVRTGPMTHSRLRLDVQVPAGTKSGAIVLIAADGSSSVPSRTAVAVVGSPALPGVTGERMIWPVSGPITGVFGEDRGDHYHSGLDIAASGGTPIKAAATGTVILAESYGGYGNYTCVAHTVLTTCYAHQSRFGVSVGDGVRRGQVIGYVGNTGNSFGNHLHFEVRNGSSASSPVLNPVAYLPARSSASFFSPGRPLD